MFVTTECADIKKKIFRRAQNGIKCEGEKNKGIYKNSG
jgi:hypothetical protein